MKQYFNKLADYIDNTIDKIDLDSIFPEEGSYFWVILFVILILAIIYT